MATTQDRNQDETAKAAKVIRILHENHAAASDYLRSLHDASHMSRSDFRSYLRHAPLEEYLELVEPLDKSQKAALYEKVSHMKDRRPISPIDKEATKSFFKLLELKEKGLSLKDVRKEVKKAAPSVDHTIASPAVSTPQPEASTKKKRKRTEDTPASQSTPLASGSTSNVDRQSKKQKTKSLTVQPPSETPARPVLSKSQRKREAKKARLATMSVSLTNEDIHPPTVHNTATNPEAETPARPVQKKQKTRRGRRKPKVTTVDQSGSPAADASSAMQKTPEQEEVDLPMSIPDHNSSAPENASTLHPDSNQPPSNDDDVPVPAPNSPSSVRATEISTSSPGIENTTQVFEALLSSPRDASPEKEISTSNLAHREPPGNDVDVQMSSPKYESPAHSATSSLSSHGSPAQAVAAPISSPDRGSPEMGADVPSSSPAQESVARPSDLPTSSPESESPAQEADRAVSSPESTTGLPASSPLRESPTPKSSIPLSITRTALPLTNRPEITTAIEGTVEPPRVEGPNSPRPGSSSEFDLRAGPIAFSMPAITSNPVTSSTERQSATPMSSLRNHTSRPTASEIVRSQSSRPSVEASPFSGRPRVIPSASTATDDSSFRNFSRFLSGKGSDEDDSSSDDESSSSSSSDDETDTRPSQPPPPSIAIQASEPERQKENVVVETSPINVNVSNEQPGQAQEAVTISQISSQDEESSNEAAIGSPVSEVDDNPDVADVQAHEDLEMTDCPVDEPGPSTKDADSQNIAFSAGALAENAAHEPFGSQEHPPSCRITSPSPTRGEDNKSSAQKTDRADPVTFTSFHETLSPQDDPSPSPVPEIPDLMEFGGYRPAYERERASSVLPGQSHPAPEAMGSVKQDSDGGQEVEIVTDENLVHPTGTNEDPNSSNYVSEPGPTIQTSDPSSPIQVNDTDPEVIRKEALNVDDIRSSSPIPFFGSDDTTEEQTKLLDGFRGVFEQSEEQFLTRMASLRSRLELGTGGTTEGCKAMFEELLEEVTREEAVHISKLSAAKRAVERDVPEARIRMFKIIDHAGERFEQTILSTRTALQKEYSEHISGSQLPSGSKEDDTKKDVLRPEAMVVIETPSKAYKAQFANSSFASEQAYEATFASTQDDGEKVISDAPEKAESVRDHEEESPIQEPPKRKRKSTGLASEHFATPSPAKKKRVPAGTSAVPFPKLSAPRFGLIQEELAGEPFRLLIAVTFLNKTAGRAAVPIYRQLMELYPTPSDLAAASIPDISELIRPLGLQNQRAKKLVRLAQTWVDNPPQKGIRHRTRDYPVHGDGRDLKPTQTLEDAENCAGALEIGHMYGLGPYAYDSWRIFCRDVFRGVAQSYNGQGVQGYSSTDATSQSTFEPEWKRVVPLDKELRACLRWMWLREGWEWDPLTGRKKVANVQLVREASNGVATWDEPDTTPQKDEASSVGGSGIKSQELKIEIESPEVASFSPEVPAETPASPPVTRRATRSSTRLRLSRNLETGTN